MKTIKIGLAALMLLVLAGPLSAQNTEKKERRDFQREKRLRKEQALQASRDEMEKLANNRSILLEANALYGKYLNRWNTSSDNFVAIDGNKMVLQTASPYRAGYNGLGGITLEGRITNYKLSDKQDKGPIIVTASVITPWLGTGTLRMSISANGNGSATFSDVWGHRITFVGQIENLENARVFEGMTL